MDHTGSKRMHLEYSIPTSPTTAHETERAPALLIIGVPAELSEEDDDDQWMLL
jgi:hypothetical protein